MCLMLFVPLLIRSKVTLMDDTSRGLEVRREHMSESRLCPTLLDVAVTASTIDNGEAVITDVARVSWCFIIDVSAPCLLLLERLAYNGRAWTWVDGSNQGGDAQARAPSDGGSIRSRKFL